MRFKDLSFISQAVCWMEITELLSCSLCACSHITAGPPNWCMKNKCKNIFIIKWYAVNMGQDVWRNNCIKSMSAHSSFFIGSNEDLDES